MKHKIIDGTMIAKKIFLNIKQEINQLKIKNKRCPKLSIILIGSNPASEIYINKKKHACQQVGITAKIIHIKQTTNESNILSIINTLNIEKHTDGIVVQLPLPQNINTINILKKINIYKDVDGLHPYNTGRLCHRSPKLRACTPYGIVTLLKEYKIKTHGLHAVIIGASNLVGRPMSLELLLLGCTVTITHKFTHNLSQYIQQADILIVAVGIPNFIKGDNIKKGAIIIDVGINRLMNGTIVGDVDFNSAIIKASYITPVPGGVGPMTIATLLTNTLQAYHQNLSLNISS
ncbi:MAG: bifunctional methylenetetrahydrofolate dehydrogenase/methenyltetrahydrofolate cyclohydrolase FolD [Buchnera aphidicola (Eriosoma harunire)]